MMRSSVLQRELICELCAKDTETDDQKQTHAKAENQYHVCFTWRWYEGDVSPMYEERSIW